ncbi:UDP-N-acetylmuramate dehydrogenase [Isoptericola dokdonensis]|uniref:UDP-N-acetylenolpyruvoylglucosamine reductase n=1 Tax=Isoptericola dokdonensis DS-3 TaxID=1300344 RepID=A0A161IHL2_9MICO|nr:UDP-N-acetylmuramate dehydrogenase [Isoptericola dokdonensis]ANC31214.1 UDP-N-acetylenolpyruvoylglucosamine reductase [Isoptericola dokdonensis DS-3]
MSQTAQQTSTPADDAPAPTLAELTTLRVGGPVGEYVEATTEAELIDAVRAADDAGAPLLVVGGGSNLLVADAGFDGVVVRDVRQGLDADLADSCGTDGACGGASLSLPAGQDWDAFVEQAVANEWVGVEALSGIPGTLGAAPVQNIGAYGQEVSGVVASVRTWDRATGQRKTLTLSELGFGYRTSVLKRTMRAAGTAGGADLWYPTPRYVVLEVNLQMRLGSLSAPIGYGELARTLGIEVGQRAPSADVRAAVLELRGGKGMLLDGVGGAAAPDHDRWSAGSFFTNPIVSADDAATLPEDAPRYPVRSSVPESTVGPSLGAVDPSLVKTSAAWLIERAGFTKGFGVAGEHSPARLSTRHTLALTNRGGATAQDVVTLARAVRDGVRDRFGVELEPEPVLVGLAL